MHQKSEEWGGVPLLLAVLLRCCEGAGVAGAELCLSVVVRPWSSPFGCVCQCLGSVRGRVVLGDDGPVAAHGEAPHPSFFELQGLALGAGPQARRPTCQTACHPPLEVAAAGALMPIEARAPRFLLDPEPPPATHP